MFCPADNNFIKQKNFGMGLNKSYRYRIFDSTNVLPMFFVKFNPNNNLPLLSSKRKCEECEIKDADKYCVNDQCYLCTECSNIIHGDASNDKAIKQIFDHTIHPVTKIKPGKCFFDHDKDAEFFCKNCNLPICSYCKVMGSHSRNEALTHPLEEISLAYNRFSPDSNDVIKNVEDKKKIRTDLLTKIKSIIE